MAQVVNSIIIIILYGCNYAKYLRLHCQHKRYILTLTILYLDILGIDCHLFIIAIHLLLYCVHMGNIYHKFAMKGAPFYRNL